MNTFSTVMVRETNIPVRVNIGSNNKPKIPKKTTKKWQSVLDTITQVTSVPTGLIMKLNQDTIEVFQKNNSPKNPYLIGEKVQLKFGLYCETVIGTQKKLYVANALKDELWKDNNLDSDLNMISYLGYPINWPDDEVFGTICILDSKEIKLNKTYENLILHLKNLVENDLKLSLQNHTLKKQNLLLKKLNTQFIEKSNQAEAFHKTLNEEEKKVVFNYLPIAICSSKGTEVSYMNKKFEELLGYTIQDTPDWDSWFLNVFPDEDYRKEAYATFIEDVEKYKINPSEVEERTYTLTAKNGTKKQVEISFTMIDDTITGSFIDITQKLESEKQLKESREHFKLLFEQSKIAKIIINPETGFIENANNAALNFYGYTKEELCNKKISDINQLSEKEVQREMLLAKNNERDYFEFKHKLSDGSIKDVSVFTSTIDFSGEKKLASIIIDVTQKKSNELAIIENKNRFKAMFEQANAVKLIIDPETQCIEQANHAAINFYGYSLEQLKKMKISDINILDKDTIADLLNHTVVNKRSYNEFKHQLASGEIRDVQAYTSIIKINKKDKVYVLYYDNTKQKIAEQQLKESIATKDKFFSIISHDLRAPFNNVLGFSNILAKQVKEKNYESIEEYANIIENSSQKAMDLLNNLIEWSSIQTNKMEYNPKVFDLSKSVKKTIDLLEYVAKQKNITIQEKLPEKAIISADRQMVDTIFRNLISNAIKFTNTQGKIKVKIKQKSKKYSISIEDNGIGMDEMQLKNIFQIDKNISTSGTQKETGTGLGLILCKEFVDLHGGKINVKSTPKKGTKFCIELPLSKEFSF
ncbi:MAG: PAS domain S-box protein [Flavobacteriaceae bacterium]|nr:PAS domain S-box protein [Flavobacteriaceae bacterium]